MSSKQSGRRGSAGGPASRGEVQPPATGPAAKPVAPTGNGSSVPTRRPQSGAPVRVAPAKPVAKPGVKVRPIDIALIVAGLAVVAAIIWGGMNAGTTTPGEDTGKTLGVPTTDTGAAKPPRNLTPLPTGDVAADFSLPANDGNTYSLSQFKGKVVLLEFMAPWCPHCQADSVEFNKVWDSYKDKGVQVLGVSATPYGHNYENNDNTPISMADLTWFRDNFATKYPLLLDTSLNAADNYHIRYFPTLYLIGKDGKVIEQMLADDSGALTFERIGAELDKAIKASGSAPAQSQAAVVGK